MPADLADLTLRPSALRDAVAGYASDGQLADPIEHALAVPGKHLRSRLVFVVGGLAGTRAADGALHDAALAVELFHLASLTHDDIADDSPLRRGSASVGAEFGAVAAGYAGTWLVARAARCAARGGPDAARSFARAALAVCEGQMLETQDLHDVDRPVERLEHAMAGKTAALFVMASDLAALASGLDPGMRAACAAFAHDVGMAYQFADDVLDLVGGPETGKRPADDLRHGVFTLPVLLAAAADPEIKLALRNTLDDAAVADIAAAITRTDAVERTLDRCRSHVTHARERAAEIDPGGSLAAYLTLVMSRCPAEFGL